MEGLRFEVLLPRGGSMVGCKAAATGVRTHFFRVWEIGSQKDLVWVPDDR